MANIEVIKWDGVADKDIIAKALLSYIREEDKELARKTSYGDLGKKLAKEYGSRYNSGNSSGYWIFGEPNKVKVETGHNRYILTWNKAAKLIHEKINHEAPEEGAMIKMEQYIEDALDFWHESVNRYYAEVNPNNPPQVKGNTLKLIFQAEEDQEFRTDYGRIEAERRGIILYEGKDPVQGISWEKLSTLLDKKNSTLPVPLTGNSQTGTPQSVANTTNNAQGAAQDKAGEQDKALPDVPHMSTNAQYAYNVHAQIVLGAQMVENGLYQMAKGFKIMRDDKLYKELGYKSFEEYCEKGTGIKRRQVYNYITILEKLPDDFVQSTAQIGSEKLRLLTALTDEQRTELTNNTDIESVTVRELKAQIERMNGIHNDDVNSIVKFKNMAAEEHEKVRELEEQVKELNNLDITDTAEYTEMKDRLDQYAARCTANEKEIADKKQRVRELEAQIKELESRPIEVQGLDENSRAKLEFELKYKAAYEYVNLAGIAAAKAGNKTEIRKKLTALKTMIDGFLK